MLDGADILNGRGLLETISLASRCLDAERELAELRSSEQVRTWAITVVQKSGDFRERLRDMLQRDRILTSNLPEDSRRERIVQEMAAEFVARVVNDACKGATLHSVENMLDDSMVTRLNTLTFTGKDYNIGQRVERR